MDVTVSPAMPAPGTAKIGDLLVDQQTRTLWLGVDPAVDPNEVLLISDIESTLAAIAEALDDANAYTDTQIATRAPLSHTHVSTQITDFNAAVAAVVTGLPGFSYVTGMIMQYAGSLANIGVGALAGWALCDGSNGTPDLRDRFVIGAGNKATGDKNTPSNAETNLTGSHTHTNAGTALTTAQLPAHAHAAGGLIAAGNTGYESANHTHSQYTATGYTVEGGLGATGLASGTGGFGTQTGGVSANHYHSFNVAVTGNTANQGSGATHTHTMDAQGDHKHTITPLELREKGIAYYALAFIMKL